MKLHPNRGPSPAYRSIATATLLAAAVTVAFLPATASAGKEGGRHGQFFQKMDQNQDGAISQDEFTAAHDQFFGRWDADNDGAITRGEFMRGRGPKHQAKNGPEGDARRARRQQHKETRFNALDTDGSGSISREEFAAGHNATFARKDADGDGRLTRDEMRRRKRQ